jgi:hypothetical protein
MVGDGSVSPPRLYRTPVPLVRPQWTTPRQDLPPPKPFQNPFLLFTYPDIVILLAFNGIFYSVFYGVTATISSLFTVRYPYLSETAIGLVFLSVGGGMVVGSTFTGKLLDSDFRRIKGRLDKQHTDGKEKKSSTSVHDDFPIEYARLRTLPLYLAIYVTAVVGYGWSLRFNAHIAVPIILQFISMFSTYNPSLCLRLMTVGYTIVALMNTVQTLLVDLLPGRGAAVTGAVHLLLYVYWSCADYGTEQSSSMLFGCDHGVGHGSYHILRW